MASSREDYPQVRYVRGSFDFFIYYLFIFFKAMIQGF